MTLYIVNDHSGMCVRTCVWVTVTVSEPIPIQLSSYFLPASSSHTCPIASFSDDILTNLFPRAPLPLVSHFVTIWPTWPGHERYHWRPVMADLCSPFICVIASCALQQSFIFLVLLCLILFVNTSILSHNWATRLVYPITLLLLQVPSFFQLFLRMGK